MPSKMEAEEGAGKSNAPLLLVHVEQKFDSISGNDTSLTLNQSNVTSLLGQVGDRPLSVYTITGPKDSGKSLLFGYMIKFLTAAEKDNPDWIDWTTPEKPLAEFHWSSMNMPLISPDKPGIWCFNRPFILKSEEDPKNEIAVLLLYSQSSERSLWMKEDSQLMGLSIAAASYTIFNVPKNVTEKCLSAIGDYVRYSIYGSKLENPKKNLGNAMFAIRDWNFPSAYPYGVAGGSKFLHEEKLLEGMAHSKDSRNSRQLIKSTFGHVSGCLLPFPGSRALEPEFQGSIGEMETLFVEKLEHFVSELINLDEPLLKRNSKGEIVRGGEAWKAILEAYIQNVNNKQLNVTKVNEIMGIKIISSVAEQKQMMRSALKSYMETWKRAGKDCTNMKEKELKGVHKRAKKNALEAWKKMIYCEGGSYSDDEDEDASSLIDKTVEKHLSEKIEERFLKIKKENERTQLESLEQWKEEMMEQYKSCMEAGLISQGGKIRSSKTMKELSQETIDNLVEDFSCKITEGVEEHEKEIFRGELKIEEDKFLRRLNGGKCDDNMRNHQSEDLELNDSLSVMSIQSSSSTTVSDLETVAYTTPEPPKSTENSYEGNQNSFSFASITAMEEEETMREILCRKKMSPDEMKQSMIELIDTMKDQYIRTLESTGDLEKQEDVRRQKGKILEKFEVLSVYPPESEDFKLFREDLQAKLEFASVNLKLERNLEKKRRKEKLNQALLDGLARYQNELEKFVSGNEGNVKASQLEDISSRYLRKELDTLSEQLLENEKDQFLSLKEELEKKILGVFEKMKNDLETKQNFADQQSRGIWSSYRQKYIEIMNEKMSVLKTEKKFREESEIVMKNILEEFRNENSKRTVKKHRNELERSLTEASNDLRTKFKLKLEGSVGEAKLVCSKAREFYCLEMAKHFKNHESISENELLKLHKAVVESTLAKFSDGSQSHSSGIKEVILVEWQRYQDENKMNMEMEPAIGIDLGTTFSCVSVYQRGEVKIIPNSMGKLTTPSYVLFSDDGEIVGEEAKTRAYENPEGTIFDAKRILGRKFDDKFLQEDMKLWPFTVVDGGHGVPMIEVNGKRLNPEMISAKVLAQLKKDAEMYLKRKVTKAVITVPAYFTDGQKQASIDAGKMAGLKVLSIMTEPVAAAMAYKLQYANQDSRERHILVFDLGGGTFDVALLKTTAGKIEVQTIDGDRHLGGEDFDKKMMEYCAGKFKEMHNIDLFHGKDSVIKRTRDDVRRRLRRLQSECEKNKILLTTARSATVTVNKIYKNIDLKVTITRANFERMNAEYFQSTIQVVDKALKSINLESHQIDDIVLVGGSTRIPKIQKLIKDYFNGKTLNMKINPDEAVAHGAGLYAAIRKGDVSEGSSAYTKVQEVTPMPLGVEVYGGGFSIIIPKGTPIPVMLQELYKTAHNNQTSVQITVYEGDNPVAASNEKLGDFYLNNIPPKDAGVENIEVEMVINDQGILHVTAKCKSTGQKRRVTVKENKQRMSEAAIKQYLAEASG